MKEEFIKIVMWMYAKNIQRGVDHFCSYDDIFWIDSDEDMERLYDFYKNGKFKPLFYENGNFWERIDTYPHLIEVAKRNILETKVLKSVYDFLNLSTEYLLNGDSTNCFSFNFGSPGSKSLETFLKENNMLYKFLES